MPPCCGGDDGIGIGFPSEGLGVGILLGEVALAEKYDSPLFPVTPEAKGRMLQWAFYIAK